MYGIAKDKKIFLLGTLIIMALLLGTLVFYSEKKEKLEDDIELTGAGAPWRVYVDFMVWKKYYGVKTKEDFKNMLAYLKTFLERDTAIPIEFWYSWLGIPSIQSPLDNWKMQEMITALKPDFIIETGTYKGGTTLFYATVLEKVNKDGKIITVDISPQVEEASKFKTFKDMVIVIKGDSVSPDVIDEISKYVKENHKVLVILDSLHTKEHVLKELKLYSNFVSLNSYIIVAHTLAYLRDPDNSPLGAIKEFLKNNKNFEIDHTIKIIGTTYLFLKTMK